MDVTCPLGSFGMGGYLSYEFFSARCSTLSLKTWARCSSLFFTRRVPQMFYFQKLKSYYLVFFANSNILNIYVRARLKASFLLRGRVGQQGST